jgi:hypothetical protein
MHLLGHIIPWNILHAALSELCKLISRFIMNEKMERVDSMVERTFEIYKMDS